MPERSPGSPDVSIVIVSYRNPDLTRDCLRSVFAETTGCAYEVLVIDNASGDGTAEMVANEFPAVQLHALDQNIGFARANNFGVARAIGRYVVLLNPDTVVLGGALQALVRFARTNPEGGIYGGRTLRADGQLDPQSCWGAPTLWSAFCFATGLSTAFRSRRHLNPESLGAWQRDTVREVGVVTGCLLAMERRVWNELGGFDERFFMYGEDTDLSLRASAAGYRPLITPSATITHLVGASSDRGGAKMSMVMRARVTLMHKHWSSPRRRAGILLLCAGVKLRAAGASVISLRSGSKAPSMWQDVWRRRADWLVPYQLPAPIDPEGSAGG